jgi:sugar phosphate isomerase/epimerase
MRIPSAGAGAHLTYCTNIHPAETWAEVRANLEQYVLRVRQRIAPQQRFGVGLRLSACAAAELSSPAALEELRAFLDEHALYVFTINGFPYGAFHATRVKEGVYRPDWLEEPRLDYSNTLAEILAALLPDDGDLYGSVSTVPIAYRPRVRDGSDLELAATLLARHAARLAAIRERTGKLVVLALEPEPCCVLETASETAAFFEQRLFGEAAAACAARAMGCDPAAARETLRRHVGVCLDACHAAVEFEDVAGAVATLESAGVRIAKIQISAGLDLPRPTPAALARLHAFADDVYLHQVVERRGSELERYADLPEALAAAGTSPGLGEWRIHFHVPLHREHLGPFSGTQRFVRDLLARQRRSLISPHLEVETYTWSVLPPEHRGADVVDDVAREMEWVLEQLRG